MIVEWGPLLKRWSEEWLEALAAQEPEEFEELDEETVRDRWLGFAPAGPARMAALRERVRGLGIEVPLPPSLCSFLETTNGWRHAGGFVHLLARAESVAPYGDPYGLQPMYEEQLCEDAAEEEVLLAGMWGRALQLSLESDMTDVLLDPGDVGADGEWAVYVYHGWGGEPPDRYDSFRSFMEHMYKEFYRLGGDCSRFETAVTHALDAKVEEARLACLRGRLDEALAVFDEAREFGRPRAGLLAAQLLALLRGSGWVPVDPRMDDPLYANEVLPLKVCGHLRDRRSDDTFVLGPVTRDHASDRERAVVVLEQIRQRTYTYTSPGPFGRAVEEARELARRGDTDGAWRIVAAAVPRWEPYREDHVAPFGLLGDPLLGPVVTPERARQLLTTPRAGQTGEGPPSARPEEGAVQDGLAWLTGGHPHVPSRNACRFVLVEGIRPEELAERFGTGPVEPPASETDLWELQFSRQGERRGPVARIGTRDGWSFAFESAEALRFDTTRLTHPGTVLSRGTRALTVWRQPGLFHFACAEDGEQRYLVTVHGVERHETGTPPAGLSADRLFPGPARSEADLSGQRRALEAIGATFGVSLPRFALDVGRLPTLPTKPWIRPPGPGDAYATFTMGSG